MNIKEKTTCGQDILETQDKIAHLNSLIEFITKAKSNEYEAYLTIETPRYERMRPDIIETLTREEIIIAIRRKISQKQKILDALIEHYNTIL